MRILIAIRRLLLLAALLPALRAAADQAEVEYVPSRSYFSTALREIDAARASVDVFLYSFQVWTDRPGSGPLALADALRRARERGARVRVVLDEGPDPDDPGAPPDGRNGAARDYLAAAGVPVFMDDPAVVTHAKVLVVDGRTVLLGSSNWTDAAFNRNTEADVLVRSPELARDVLRDMERRVPNPAPAVPPVPVPWDLMVRPDLLGRMVARHDERAFDVYLYLLKCGGAGTLDVRALAGSLGLDGMTREACRRQVRKVLVKLRDDYRLIRFDQDYNGDPRVEVLPSSSTTAVPVPLDYWDRGWNRRLDFPGKTFLLLSLAYSRASPDRPRWTVPGDVLASRHHVSRGFVSRGVVALRRAGLVDVEYGELGRDPGPRNASVYTPRGLYDPLELERKFRDLLEKYGEERLARARRYAALVYDDSDAPAVERLILLEEERGPARMEKAAALLAAKNPDNPRRTMAYLINTVRNLP